MGDWDVSRQHAKDIVEVVDVLSAQSIFLLQQLVDFLLMCICYKRGFWLGIAIKNNANPGGIWMVVVVVLVRGNGRRIEMMPKKREINHLRAKWVEMMMMRVRKRFRFRDESVVTGGI